MDLIALGIALYIASRWIVSMIFDVQDREKVSRSCLRTKRGQPVKVNRRNNLGTKGRYS